MSAVLFGTRMPHMNDNAQMAMNAMSNGAGSTMTRLLVVISAQTQKMAMASLLTVGRGVVGIALNMHSPY